MFFGAGICAAAVLVPGLFAQPRAGAVELFGQGGVAFRLPEVDEIFSEGIVTGLRAAGATNIRVDSGAKTKWYAGGGAGYSFSRNIQLVGEYNRAQLAKTRVTFTPRGLRTESTATLSARIDEFNVGMHYLFASKSRVTPYLAGAVGIARLTGSGSVQGASSFSASESDLTVNFGGGIRLYGGEKWGFRPDFRVVRLPGQTYLRAAGVFFLHLGGN
jgi:hypothetical protein